MINPPILTVDWDVLAGILRTGKPAGLWMARLGPASRTWMGVDSRPGHLTIRKNGTFPEVLTWLMRRAGIIGKGQIIKNRIHDGEPEILIHKVSAAAYRVENPVLSEWTGVDWIKDELEFTMRADMPRMKRKRRRRK